ncbi:MAG: hypothetical protein M0Z30_19460 [Actinomycetota bacterium]|nr:hypothetical protein [Actinomycetota bacterium]
MIGEFVKLRGRQPTATEVIRLRQRTTLETRPDKVHRSLAEMTTEWGIRSIPYVDGEPESWVASLADRNDLPVLRSDDIESEILHDMARVALDKVASNRATFSRWNVAAEVHRQLHGVRFVAPAERIQVAERATVSALARALIIEPPELHHTPARILRPDGSSRFRATGRETSTTTATLEAEARLPRRIDTGRCWPAPGCLRSRSMRLWLATPTGLSSPP